MSENLAQLIERARRVQMSDADKAKHPCDRSGAIDNTQERRLIPLTTVEEASPPRTKVLTPLYEAKVDPDIYFFGFDLTVEKAKGGTGENPADDPGWFFVIKERPGEPRFGLDDAAPVPDADPNVPVMHMCGDGTTFTLVFRVYVVDAPVRRLTPSHFIVGALSMAISQWG